MMARLEFINELRPCYVNGDKCLFHTWEQYKNCVVSREISGIRGIVEFENGEVQRVEPYMIHFCDSKEKMIQYNWGE